MLQFIDGEVAKRGGGSVTFYVDELAVIGSIKIIIPGLSELCGLGFIEWQRYPKRHQISLSSRWRDITTAKRALIVSAVARSQRTLMSPQPATASTHAQAYQAVASALATDARPFVSASPVAQARSGLSTDLGLAAVILSTA